MTITDHFSGKLSELDRQVVSYVPAGGNWRNLPIDFPSKRVKQIREGSTNGGGSRSTYYGRLAWDKPSYTINTYINRPGNGCFIHPEASRLITVREAARLQSFPDDVRFQGSMRARCKQVGNAVPPLLARAIGSTIPAGNVVDLFAGAGGFGLGLEMAGHDVLLSSDFDRSCIDTLETYAKGDVVLADMNRPTELKHLLERTRSATGELDLLVGGPPCQGFSTAGPCRIQDPRNRLVLAFLQFIEEVRPKRVLMENVVALRWRGGVFLTEFEKTLSELGYSVQTRILHAEGYGVPQLRRRLIVQAVRGEEPVWPVPTHQIRNPAFMKDQPGGSGPIATNTVRDAISDLPFSESRSLNQGTDYATEATSSLQMELRCRSNASPSGTCAAP